MFAIPTNDVKSTSNFQGILSGKDKKESNRT
jgi:hypothetical protein